MQSTCLSTTAGLGLVTGRVRLPPAPAWYVDDVLLAWADRGRVWTPRVTRAVEWLSSDMRLALKSGVAAGAALLIWTLHSEPGHRHTYTHTDIHTDCSARSAATAQSSYDWNCARCQQHWQAVSSWFINKNPFFTLGLPQCLPTTSIKIYTDGVDQQWPVKRIWSLLRLGLVQQSCFLFFLLLYYINILFGEIFSRSDHICMTFTSCSSWGHCQQLNYLVACGCPHVLHTALCFCLCKYCYNTTVLD